MAKPKTVFEKLTTVKKNFIKKKLGIKKIQDAKIVVLKKLKEELKKLKDVRIQHLIIYKQWDIIMCVILASFADNNDWEDIHNFVVDNYKWLKSFLQMTGGIPSSQTYERVMSLVDNEELNKILFDFFKSITMKEIVETKLMNIDGRVNNGSKRQDTFLREKVDPLNCLNAYSNEYGYCIYSKQITDKSNEIPAVEDLINGLDLTDVIVTWDALNTQVKNVEAVIKANGDYIVPIKGNQGVFHQDLIDYFDDDCCDKIIAGNSKSKYLQETEKSHGSIIKYEYFETSDIDWYDRLKDWKKIKGIGMVRKTITSLVTTTVEKKKNGKKVKEKQQIEKTTVEKRYYISSRNVNIKEFAEAVRSQWNVEDKVHWHLDFTFRQDSNKTLNKRALLNLEIIHKFVLGILTKVKPEYNMSLKSIRKHLSNNFEEFFPELLCLLMLH